MASEISSVRPDQLNDAPDHVLVAMARRSIPLAMDVLIDRHYSTVQRFLTRQVQNHDLAQDHTQEVFTTALTHLGQLNDDAAFLPWLYRIARNQCHSSRRDTMRLLPLAVVDWIGAVSSSRMTSIAVHGRSIADIDEAAVIQHVLDRLRPEYRELLLLRHLAGFSLDEVAAIVDCSRATTQRRINRAEARFRNQYAMVQAQTDGRQVI